MKTVIILVVLLGFVCGNEEDLKIIDSIVQEQPCRGEGGVCTIATDCPEGQLVEGRGLCPTQMKQGIECCYGISIKETRCSKRGGRCMKQDEYCNPKIVFEGAKDCPKDTRCCILVR